MGTLGMLSNRPAPANLRQQQQQQPCKTCAKAYVVKQQETAVQVDDLQEKAQAGRWHDRCQEGHMHTGTHRRVWSGSAVATTHPGRSSALESERAMKTACAVPLPPLLPQLGSCRPSGKIAASLDG